MHFPKLTIDREKLKNNIQAIMSICRSAGIDICAVTKVFCADSQIAGIFVEAGVKTLADSRILNLKKLREYPVRKMMLRTPMLSEVEEVVKYSDISLNSELQTIKDIAEAAVRNGVTHEVILMVELGDLREGIMIPDVIGVAGEVLKLHGVKLVGVGTNLNCYGGVLPTEKNLSELVEIARQIEQVYQISLPVISGGNSGSFYLLKDNLMPKGVNQLRLGEVILRGYETSFQKRIDGLFTDVFTFRAEIVEIKNKPSVPFGQLGIDAFGNKCDYEDKGIMNRAILACGRQDVPMEHLMPLDKGIEFIGSSSDHMIIDITHAEKSYHLGSIVDFSLDYGALLAACTSEYVCKQIV